MTAKTMAEVLAEHQLSVVWQDADETGITCMCGMDVPTEIERNEIDTQFLAAHQAEALSAAGFGLVADTKAEALEEAARKVMGPSEYLADAATCHNIANDLRQSARLLRGNS